VPVERGTREPAFETYLHRIGRSGRFGRKGAAFNLICGEFVSGVGSKLKQWEAGSCRAPSVYAFWVLLMPAQVPSSSMEKSQP
jgi:superfamily II DNA/RNA helicase